MKLFTQIVFTLSLFIFSNGVFAQSMGGLNANQTAEIKAQIEEYTQALNLSNIQKPKFKALIQQYGKELKAINDSDASKMDKLKKAAALKESNNLKVEELLSKEQYATFLKKQKEIENKVKQYRK